MSDFAPGFSARHDAAAGALQQAFNASDAPKGFVAADLRDKASGKKPKSFSPEANPPKHFAPADRSRDPTEGWDPLSAELNDKASSFIDPVETARAAGFAEGAAYAQAQARDHAARDQALLGALASAVGDAGRIDREAVARKLRQTIMLMVNRLVGDIGVSADLLTRRIEAAVDLLADSTEAAVLRVNPDDAPLLDGKLPASLHALGDAMIDRGSFVLEAASTIVEEGPELWLEQLAQVIDQVAVSD